MITHLFTLLKLKSHYQKQQRQKTLNTGIRRHIYKPRDGHFDKSKLASRAFEEGYQFDWTNATIWQFDPKSIYRKYKEAANILCSKSTISKPSLDISLTWLPLTDKRFPQVRADVIHHTYERQVLCRRFLDTPIQGVDWVDYTSMKFFYYFAILGDEIISFSKGNISLFI